MQTLHSWHPLHFLNSHDPVGINTALMQQEKTLITPDSIVISRHILSRSSLTKLSKEATTSLRPLSRNATNRFVIFTALNPHNGLTHRIS